MGARREIVRGFLVAGQSLFQSRFATLFGLLELECPSGVILWRMIRLVAMGGLAMPDTRRRVGESFTAVLARVSMFIGAREVKGMDKKEAKYIKTTERTVGRRLCESSGYSSDQS